MDVLIPVFVAVLLAETGGRVQTSVRPLFSRFPNDSSVIVTALALATVTSLLIAAIGSAVVAKLVDHRALTLLAGLAMVFAGVPLLLRAKRPEVRGERPFVASVRAFAPAQLGGASQFIVFALAARGGSPALAFFGGMAAILVAAALPMFVASDGPGRWPISAMRRGAGIILSLAGIAFAASAFRVI